MVSVKIDPTIFHRHALRISDLFKKSPNLFGGADCLLIAVTASSDENSYEKGTSCQTWLLGYQFTDTILVISKDRKVAFLTSPKKAAYLAVLKDGSADVEIFSRSKDDNNFESLLKFIKSCGSKVGIPIKDKHSGSFADDWKKVSSSWTDIEFVDASIGISMSMATKDPSEIALVSTASKVAAALMKNFFMEEMSAIIDDDKKVPHNVLSSKIEEAIGDNIEKSAKKYGFPADMDLGLLDWAYEPIIQSGGEFDLRPNATSSSKDLHFGTIICSLGVRYRDYCCNVARTFMINPTKQQEKNYEFTLTMHAKVLDLLTPGTRCCDVYNGALEFIRANRPDLEQNLPKSLGFATGIEFREPLFLISSTNENKIQESSVFNIAVGLQNLVNPDASDPLNSNYAILICDTVCVTSDKLVTMTAKMPRASNEVVFVIEEDDDSNQQKALKSDEKDDSSVKIVKTDQKLKETNSQADSASRSSAAAIKARRRVDAEHQASSAARAQHQLELARNIQAEGLRRYKSVGEQSDEAEKRIVRKYESYKSTAGLPRDCKPRIMIDARSESILFPMNGLMVPFHISTLKNVSKSDEGEYVCLRFNFVTPGQSIVRKDELAFEDASATFVKTLTYRSTDAVHMNDVYRLVTEMRKQSQKAEAERKDMADIVEQASLEEIKGHRPVTLADLYARPTLDSKRVPGELQIHSNGLRYVSRLKSDNRIDILFSNIRHLFFQPCDKELIVLIHVHLRNPIMIGKKKTKDVQFFKEAGEAVYDDTVNRRRRAGLADDDELFEEQEELRRRAQLNKEFKDFAERIVASQNGKLELDIPYRDLAFEGVPFRASVIMQPTTECLVHLSEPPFFVTTLSDVELVHFERVSFGLRQFDMVIVFNDFSRAPAHVNAIPVTYLELIKDWLDSMNIYFTEGELNLNWSEIMKTVNSDRAGFFEDGGWGFLALHSNSEDGSSEESVDSDEAVDMSALEEESSEEDLDSEEDYESESSEEEEEEEESDVIGDTDESDYDDRKSKPKNRKR